MKGGLATREELERIGRELVEKGRIIDYLVEEDQSGQLRLLVRDHEGEDMAPLEPSD